SAEGCGRRLQGRGYSCLKTHTQLQQPAADPALHGAERHFGTLRECVVGDAAEKSGLYRASLPQLQLVEALLEPAIVLSGLCARCRCGLIVRHTLYLEALFGHLAQMLPQPIDPLV